MRVVSAMVPLIALVLGLAVPTAGLAQKKVKPVKRLDRTRVVGAPVLDENASEGVYVWLEDGWFNVAAVIRSKRKHKKRVVVRVASTKKIERSNGDFVSAKKGKGRTFTAWVGDVPVKGRFKTDGDITVKAEGRIYLGPLATKGASSVLIGRF